MFWIIWLVFALIFLLLACYHWKQSSKSIPNFRLPDIPYWEPAPPAIPVNTGILAKDIKQGFENFENGFNKYVDDSNKWARTVNRVQAFGYLVACATAVFSLFFTL